LDFVHALLQNVLGFVEGDVGVVVPVHHRHGEEGAVAVGGERQFVHRRQIVHVEEARAVVGVEPADEEVDVVGRARAEKVGQVLARVMSRRFRREIVAVAVFVELDVFADKLGKLGGISRLADDPEKGFPAQRKHFVVIVLHGHDTPSRDGVGRHEDEIRPLNADQKLPSDRSRKTELKVLSFVL